jgi:hypothetical protein
MVSGSISPATSIPHSLISLRTRPISCLTYFSVFLARLFSNAIRCPEIGKARCCASRSSSGSIKPRSRSMASFSSLAPSCSVRSLSVKPFRVRLTPLWSVYETYQNARRLPLSRPRLKIDAIGYFLL